MLSKNQLKYVRQLEHKKYRRREGLFVAEGPKVVGDLLAAGFNAKHVFATEDWHHEGVTAQVVSDEELCRLSFLQHPQQVLALFPIAETILPSLDDSSLIIALDGVQDPGNMGTIIRIADWFGITTLVCSRETADIFNPKCVQATMGSIARVNVVYTDLEEWLETLPANYPVYGTFLNGNNIYKETLTNHGIIIMGNEGNGISDKIGRHVNKRLLIPNYPEGRPTADSLNVAIATAITCAEFRRR